MQTFSIYELIIKYLISMIPDMLNFIFEIRKTLLNRPSKSREVYVLIIKYIAKFAYKFLVFKH